MSPDDWANFIGHIAMGAICVYVGFRQGLKRGRKKP